MIYYVFVNFRKKSKKGVDIRNGRWYYKQARLRAPNLENDTDKETQERQSRILSEIRTRRKTIESDSEIKHKSLILAQDERWRRA